MPEIMKIIDERERKKKTKIERGKRVEQAIVKMWELNGFAARLS